MLKLSKGAKTVLVMVLVILMMAVVPLFICKEAEFGGSDNAGSDMVAEVTGEEYEAWFTPVAEIALQGELPGEVESLLFCIQTGIGVSIIAYSFGYLVARKKFGGEQAE